MPTPYTTDYYTGTSTGTSTVWNTWATNASTASTANIYTLWTNQTTVQPTAQPFAQVTAPQGWAVQPPQSYRHPDQTDEEWAEANEKAEALLTEYLGDEQVEELTRARKFCVRGSKGGVYEIHRGQIQNVYRIEGNDLRTRWCAHPRETVPDPDAMLAQALMLETDEERFLAIANRIY